MTRGETELVERVRRVTGEHGGHIQEKIQSLWSGYGAIYRFGAARGASFIVKHVAPGSGSEPPLFTSVPTF